MSKSLIDRIDRTREAWSSELEVCRNDMLDTVRLQHAVSRLVVEFDYLLVEAKLAIKANDTEISKKTMIAGAQKWAERCGEYCGKEVQNGVIYVRYLLYELAKG